MNSISITFPKLYAIRTGASEWDQAAYGMLNNYETHAVPFVGAPDALVWSETIDMSAFVIQDKTFFSRDVQISEPGIAKCNPSPDWIDSAGLEIVDLISNIPLDAATIVQNMKIGTFTGFPSDDSDNQFLLFGRYMAFTASTTASLPGLMQLAKTSTFGAGLPTASEKIYCMRVIIPSASSMPVVGATLRVFPTRYTIVGVAEEESELARIYRLRQSYEQIQRIVE
jgi:hypothetical protein